MNRISFMCRCASSRSSLGAAATVGATAGFSVLVGRSSGNRSSIVTGGECSSSNIFKNTRTLHMSPAYLYKDGKVAGGAHETASDTDADADDSNSVQQPQQHTQQLKPIPLDASKFLHFCSTFFFFFLKKIPSANRRTARTQRVGHCSSACSKLFAELADVRWAPLLIIDVAGCQSCARYSANNDRIQPSN